MPRRAPQSLANVFMLLTIEILVTGLSGLLLLLSGVLAVEIVAGLMPPHGEKQDEQGGDTKTRPRRIAVLIPAHDEVAGLGPVLDAIRPQLSDDDRLLVVADNCSDATAEVARTHGADVVERHDPSRRGKGFALDFGIAILRSARPDVVVIVDADCDVAPGTVARLAHSAHASGCPVQATYLMQIQADARLLQRVGAFAFRVKNQVRFQGLKRLGLPCTLAGTGMAFPWAVIETAALATGNIVEDMQLGIDLAIDGFPAVFEPAARVTSQLPESGAGQATQRRRWEHGHLATIRSQTPRLLKEALRQRRADLLGMALDLMVPPISLLILSGIAILVLAAALWGWGASPAAFILAGLAMALAAAALLLAWHRAARDLLSPADIVAIPAYVLGKAPLYAATIFNRERNWVRTDRESGKDCDGS